LGFDPVGGDGATATDDASANDATGDSSGMMIDAAMIDALPAACAQAIVITLGRTAPISTCTHPDLLDGCAATAKQEVVFKFTPSSTAGHTFAAYNPGTTTISNPTQLLDTNCMPVSCAGLSGRTFTAGEPVYFAVEASSVACTMIELEITSP
ncbi:MAG: hypothetical protein H0T42_30870, partial [Deltaproteobacteria bacterium]|nr:hypothetical protein [Deltaproteobacteria bacterium]